MDDSSADLNAADHVYSASRAGNGDGDGNGDGAGLRAAIGPEHPPTPAPATTSPSIWVERLTLTDFRNYRHLTLDLDARPVVLTGNNGAGKTNLMEAVSLLAPGRGLRRAPFNDLSRLGSADDAPRDGSWSVAAKLHSGDHDLNIGTGLLARASSDRAGRIVRIDGETQTGSGVLADYVEVIWLTPSMDGLFTGPASDRRRFLDTLIVSFDSGYRKSLGAFERAMRQRNRALDESVSDDGLLRGYELLMAETGVAIAATRAETLAQLTATIATRREGRPDSPFPWAALKLDGLLENAVEAKPAVDVEDDYLARLSSGRERDRAAGRCLLGPHRTDLLLHHGPKSMPAKLCSTGEQKALLVGLILAHAELMKAQRGAAPILLLDEIAAHLDEHRRAALFDEILVLGSQAWMTGTDAAAFASLGQNAQAFSVDEAHIRRCG